MQLEAALREFLPAPQADPAAEAVRRWLLDQHRRGSLEVEAIPNRDATRRAIRDAGVRAAAAFYNLPSRHAIATAIRAELLQFDPIDLYECPAQYRDTIKECLWTIAVNSDTTLSIRQMERIL